MLVSGGTPLVMGTDLSDSSPVRTPQYYGSQGIPLASSFAAYGELYRAQPWVYILVRKLGTSLSRIPIGTFRHAGGDQRTDARDTPYGELMRRPNQRLGVVGLWLWVFSTQELYGEAMLLKVRDADGRVRELLPIHPANMLVRRSEENPGRLEYAYMAYTRGAPALAAFDEADVVHFKGYNPDNVVRGLSPCEPLRQTLLAEDAMRRAQTSVWRNGARPSVVLTAKGPMSQGAIDRLRSQWDQLHTGVDNWAKTAILEDGMTPSVMQLSAEELQYVQGRVLNRDECCSVWDVPPPAVQVLDRATFSNITEQMRSLYRETAAPRFEAVEDVLASQLAPDFDASGETYASFLMDGVLRGSPEQRAAANAQRIQTGQATPAEVRAEDNMPFVEGSDQLLVNAALIPLKIVEQVAAPDGQDVIAHPQAVKGLTPKDGRDLGGRLSRVVSLDDIDEHTLVRGIESDPEHVLALVAAARARGAGVAELRTWIAAAIDHDAPEEVAP